MAHTRFIKLIARLARALDKRGAPEANEGLPIEPWLMPIDLAGSGTTGLRIGG